MPSDFQARPADSFQFAHILYAKHGARTTACGTSASRRLPG